MIECQFRFYDFLLGGIWRSCCLHHQPGLDSEMQ
jgi:hypothetical protein